ncbi:MAG: DUF2007 domain-containing protein [Acidobacteriota bacterium]|nr:DUF2007 domain-containing protein [Acidobacteriota bacterium]
MTSELKKLYVAAGPGDAYVLRGLLEAEGISAIVRGDDMVPFQGGSLFEIETRPSVWVLGNDREQYARALVIAEDYTARKATDIVADVPWKCESCGESIETQFTVCWSCGTVRN